MSIGTAATRTTHREIRRSEPRITDQARTTCQESWGRERERDCIQKKWDKARAGTLAEFGLVFRGEPGIGKSRLAAEAADLVKGSARVVLLRARASTHTDSIARAEGLAAARELARRQGAWLFEMRASLDDFELRGESARKHLVDAVKRCRMTVRSRTGTSASSPPMSRVFGMYKKTGRYRLPRIRGRRHSLSVDSDWKDVADFALTWFAPRGISH